MKNKFAVFGGIGGLLLGFASLLPLYNFCETKITAHVRVKMEEVAAETQLRTRLGEVEEQVCRLRKKNGDKVRWWKGGCEDTE